MPPLRKTVTTSIAPNLCTGCGACVRVCPSGTISLRDGKAAVTGSESMQCGHCAAVCPTGAVSVAAIEPTPGFETFTGATEWLPHGQPDLGGLVRLMASRRSCRNYLDRPVPVPLLRDLARIAATAPSGTNSQGWTFTLVPNRASVVRLGNAIADFFERINRLAANPILRGLDSVFRSGALARYHRDHQAAIERGLSQWREHGVDRLFHEAPALILVGGFDWASCPADDALLATQNLLLAAHAAGLGTCLIGFAVEAIRHAPRLRLDLSLRPGETIHAVVALGYPAERYARVSTRRPVEIRAYAPPAGCPEPQAGCFSPRT